MISGVVPISSTLWTVSIVVLVLMFVLDFLLVDTSHENFSTRQATLWVFIYVVAALAFAAFLWWHFGAAGPELAQQFIAGWVTEYSLSVDNLFVFIVLMSSFAVPDWLRHRVLLLGVAIAIVLRALLIVAGAAAIERFAATFFLFGAFLAYTAIAVWRSDDKEPDPEGNALVRWLERRVPVTRGYHEEALIVRIAGVRHLTPLFLVVLAVGTTDLLFALDSIPAIFGLTEEPYIVLAANAFALMGLRQLYFLIDGLLGRIIYLSKGLAIILGFISLKLLLHAGHEVFHWKVPEITIGQSLTFIAATLITTVVISLRAAKRNPTLVTTSELAEVEREAERHRGEALDDLPE